MVIYSEGTFEKEEPERRKIRDEYRDKFFSQLGGERLKDPFDYNPEPESQLNFVIELLDEAIARHQGDKTALHMLKASVSRSALSIPNIGAAISGRPILQNARLTNLGEFFNLKNFLPG